MTLSPPHCWYCAKLDEEADEPRWGEHVVGSLAEGAARGSDCPGHEIVHPPELPGTWRRYRSLTIALARVPTAPRRAAGALEIERSFFAQYSDDSCESRRDQGPAFTRAEALGPERGSLSIHHADRRSAVPKYISVAEHPEGVVLSASCSLSSGHYNDETTRWLYPGWTLGRWLAEELLPRLQPPPKEPGAFTRWLIRALELARWA